MCVSYFFCLVSVANCDPLRIRLTWQADGLYTYCNDKRLYVATWSFSFQVVLSLNAHAFNSPKSWCSRGFIDILGTIMDHSWC